MGCVNGSSIMIVPIKYDEALYFWKEYSPIISNKKYGHINESGEIVGLLIYEAVRQDATGCYGKLNDNWVEIKLPANKL